MKEMQIHWRNRGVKKAATVTMVDLSFFHKQVPHDNIVEHVSSILKRSGIACSGEGIDTEKLECYQHHEVMSIGGEAIEADKSSSYKGKIIKRFLGKQPPKGLAIKDVRNMFFPYWKSVLSRRLKVKMLPPCQPSRKDLLSAKASTKATKSIIDRPCLREFNETGAYMRTGVFCCVEPVFHGCYGYLIACNIKI
uniref:Uncharacterized protein n=1 Tax=Leersia perrieri TaxID=77586 RepID=A0A0D9XW27_9ORYZ